MGSWNSKSREPLTTRTTQVNEDAQKNTMEMPKRKDSPSKAEGPKGKIKKEKTDHDYELRSKDSKQNGNRNKTSGSEKQTPKRPPRRAPKAPEPKQSGPAPVAVNPPINSTSETIRLKGNDAYKSYIASTNLQDKKRHLQTAMKLYREAYEEAAAITPSTPQSTLDLRSAAKNCGTGAMKLIQVHKEINTNELMIEPCYVDAIKYLSHALVLGKASKMDDKWMKDLQSLYYQAVEYALEFAKVTVKKEERAGAIEKFIHAMMDDSQQARCYLEIATFTFLDGVVQVGEKNFKGALRALKECQRPTQECRRFAERLLSADGPDQTETLREVGIMEADLIFHLASAESLQAISIGDDLLKVGVEGDETMNLEIVYDVLDWYKKAVVGAREIDMEVEAIALSRLGCLYDRVLKIKFKAKEYFMQCMQLGVSLSPKNVNGEVWFKRCMQTMKRYQDEAAKFDDEAKNAEVQKYKEELVAELKKLSGAADHGSARLMRFVYKEFPPKNPKHRVTEDELKGADEHPKKFLLKAILHYHPDKQDVEAYGKKWQVLCSEITKELTSKYEHMKLDE